MGCSVTAGVSPGQRIRTLPCLRQTEESGLSAGDSSPVRLGQSPAFTREAATLVPFLRQREF